MEAGIFYVSETFSDIRAIMPANAVEMKVK